MIDNTLHIALVGNPNSGKTSLFNCLTGLNQQVGNFPGVTVDKKSGSTTISPTLSATVVDLPGSYSLYPRRMDEMVCYSALMAVDKNEAPDIILVVADANNLKRNLLFCSQIIDLKRPVVIALTMVDLARKHGIQINIEELERELGVPVIAINPRKQKGLTQLKKVIDQTAQGLFQPPHRDFIDNKALAPTAIEEAGKILPQLSDYAVIHHLINHEQLALDENLQTAIEEIELQNKFNPTRTQAEEILQRYARINQIIKLAVTSPDPRHRSLQTDRIDKVLLHRKWGYLILFAVLFFLFQAVFWLAQYPMDWIELGFSKLSALLSNSAALSWIDIGVSKFTGLFTDSLPNNLFSDLLVNGLLAGISGILVFVPQIMILFGLITLLEDTGYMARISFLSDRLMRAVGLNGKSVMPMISGFACAVPAIMSARSIENKKERLLTILIAPLMSCSARLPVYSILIGLVIPKIYFLGLIGLQGLVMVALYLLGFLLALLVSYIAKWFIKINERSFFILELPVYRSPRWKNLLQTMLNKAKIFLLGAGKVIIVISLVLWVLSSFGPPSQMRAIKSKYEQAKLNQSANQEELAINYQTEKLENSFAGLLGKTIEPVIKPLGYDWKIGIALITSFAAREVFVGTMATLYNVGDAGDDRQLKEKMQAAKHPNGLPVFTLASGLSLMIFYVFAMQCMSTLAVVRRETRSWKWPIIQLVYMSALAYIMSLIAYQLFK